MEKETKVQKTVTNKNFITVNGKTFEVDKAIPETVRKLLFKLNPEKAEQIISQMQQKIEEKSRDESNQGKTPSQNPPIHNIEKKRKIRFLRNEQKNKREADRIAHNDGKGMRILVILMIIGGLIYLGYQFGNFSQYFT